MKNGEKAKKIDAKIKFEVDNVDKQSGKIVDKAYIRGSIKTKTVKSGGARLEIEAGGAARYGSMGTENYQWIIKETDNSGGNVWEWIDVSVDKGLENFLREFAKSKNAKMRFSGKYTKTRTLTYNERRGIIDVLNGYDALNE